MRKQLFSAQSFLSVFCLIAFSSCSQTISVGPYLQDAEPNSITLMWETNTGDESTVEWGTSSALGNSSNGTFVTGNGASRIHTVSVSGLTESTKYFYRVITEAAQSDIYDFVTPPLPDSEASFNIISMSDMQQDWQHPNVFSDMVNDQVLPFVNERYGNDLATDLAYVFIPGDLVVTGSDYGSWENSFFDPAEALFRHVPVYPIAGNHEQNSPNYFRYFTLPVNGTNQNDYLEHWYYKDYSNVRLIGLESNSGYRIQEQLDWLQSTLNDACSNQNIDFVFAQLHHPHKSELWIDGNTDYTGQVIEILEQFSTTCGKPSAHFFGHTHGYSRGQSRDHHHLMVNVATAGGAVDNWGEFAQQDYKEFSRSDDDYGFVLVEVEAGADPQFLLTRLSHGSYEDGLVDNVIKDTVRIRLNNEAPDKPLGLFPNEGAVLSPDCILFLGSDFSDTDSQLQGATHWQVSTDDTFFGLVYDDWFQHENWYYDVDHEAGNNMVDHEITTLNENSSYFWRVRYRDRNLTWSDWSEPISFATSSSLYSDNLLLNAGAEDGVNNWTEVTGSFESIASGECAGNNAHSGSRLFAVGGVCDPNAYAEGYQDIDISSYATMIDVDSAEIYFGGYLSDYSGSDIPEFKIEFYDASNGILGTTNTYQNQSPDWTLVSDYQPVPVLTRKIRMVLMGTRNAGTDNDSYFDDLFIRIKQAGDDCEEASMGIPETEELDKALHIYPNPTNDNVFVEVTQKYLGADYKICSQTGAVLSSGLLTEKVQELDLSTYSKGVYFLVVDGISEQKFIKN